MKTIIKCAVSATLVLLFQISSFFPVSGHAGKTDTNGGHTDRETGDYHYHHGYPAHSHYDMDDDGTIDCPYEFDDKTGQNSGNPSGSGSSLQNSIDSFMDSIQGVFRPDSDNDKSEGVTTKPTSSPTTSSQKPVTQATSSASRPQSQKTSETKILGTIYSHGNTSLSVCVLLRLQLLCSFLLSTWKPRVTAVAISYVQLFV